MNNFIVMNNQGHKRIVAANRCTIGRSGSLEFWRVTAYGEGMILAIAAGSWTSCGEPTQGAPEDLHE